MTMDKYSSYIDVLPALKPAHDAALREWYAKHVDIFSEVRNTYFRIISESRSTRLPREPNGQVKITVLARYALATPKQVRRALEAYRCDGMSVMMFGKTRGAARVALEEIIKQHTSPEMVPVAMPMDIYNQLMSRGGVDWLRVVFNGTGAAP